MKAVLLYLVLVGAPLLGLLAILQYGAGLEAPPFIGGRWTIEPDGTGASRPECLPVALPPEQPEMTISQSGRYVQIQFNDAVKTSGAGRLDGFMLRARLGRTSGTSLQGLCGAKTVMQLQVRRPAGVPPRLEGEWVTPECEACPSQPFRAVRHTEQ